MMKRSVLFLCVLLLAMSAGIALAAGGGEPFPHGPQGRKLL